MLKIFTTAGYLNENGQLNLPRFEKFMQELSIFDLNNFEDVRDDLLYMEAKTGRKQTAHSKVSVSAQTRTNGASRFKFEPTYFYDLFNFF